MAYRLLAPTHTHTHTRSTANGVAAMAMALHEAFIVCLFLSFVHGLPKIYCHPARWIRLALSHSLTDTHTDTVAHSLVQQIFENLPNCFRC